MGCGQNKRPGYVNVDCAAECRPDEVVDLEETPWPWPDDCASEVLFIHSLEHMGGDPKVFLAMMQELWRICAPGASVIIHAPHPRHDDFLNDPTRVRAITPATMALFDREANEAWRAAGAANTPLALYTGVDFKLAEHEAVLDAAFAAKMADGTIAGDLVDEAMRERNNVVAEVRMTLTARKPGPEAA
jgi:hypothetical protein